MIGAKEFAARLARERRLKQARDDTDIDAKDIAETIGTSDANVSKWLAGKTMPRDEMMVKLARYFGVSAAYLRYGEGERVESGAPVMPLTKPQRGIVPRAKQRGKGKGA